MRKLKILIVEASPYFATTLERAMEHAGHTVVGTVDGALDALTLASDFKPDLALVNLNLGDGRTAQDLSRFLARQGVQVILVTEPPEFGLAVDNGVVEVQSEPAGDIALLAAVQVLSRRLEQQSDLS